MNLVNNEVQSVFLVRENYVVEIKEDEDHVKELILGVETGEEDLHHIYNPKLNYVKVVPGKRDAFRLKQIEHSCTQVYVEVNLVIVSEVLVRVRKIIR